MKIVILDGHAVNPGDLSWDFLNQFGEVTVYERTPLAEVAQRIGNADIVLTNKSPITEEILNACPNIKLVCVLATGYNVVDCAATQKRGIPVCNVPDYGTAAVAQFTFALLLDLCHKVAHHAQTVRDGKWCECPDFCYWDNSPIELAGKHRDSHLEICLDIRLRGLAGARLHHDDSVGSTGSIDGSGSGILQDSD